MENPGSSIISTLGGGSGVDFIQLADDLSEATFAFRRTSLESRNEALEARISSTALLRSSINALASSLGDRIRLGDLAPRANIDNPAVAQVSTTPGVAASGSYSLEVNQLAERQTLVLPSYGAASDLVGEGSLTIRFGEVDGAAFTPDPDQSALAITLDSSDTLSTLASKINTQSGGALDAYVAQGTNGAQLVIKSETGAKNGFVLEPTSAAASPAAAPGDLTYLGWQPASDSGQLRQSAADAIYRLDTVEQRSASNTITSLPEGISFELTATNSGAPTTIAFANDTAAITGVMTDFVAALNDLADLVAQEAGAFGGTLGNDPAARELKRDLAQLAGETVMPSAAPGEPSTLADLGLSITREGKFTLDTQRLEAALTDTPSATAAMFTAGPFGVFATIDNLARTTTLSSDPGSLGGSLNRYEGQIERNDARLEDISEQQDALRARLTGQFIAAERQIASSQSTLSFLQQQVAAWSSKE
ncbi:MAG: flagellar filament capping protein FliD [Pseudomonadota bacterium]